MYQLLFELVPIGPATSLESVNDAVWLPSTCPIVNQVPSCTVNEFIKSGTELPSVAVLPERSPINEDVVILVLAPVNVSEVLLVNVSKSTVIPPKVFRPKVNPAL